MKDLIGKEVKGFKFADKKYDGLYYNPKMDKYIGLIGIIKEVSYDNLTVKVVFENGQLWGYPIELIKKQLKEMKRTITLTVQQAKELYEKDNSFRDTLLSEFTDVELGIEKELRSWDGLHRIGGYYIDDDSDVIELNLFHETAIDNKNIFKTEKQALSSLAMAQLSQLMADLGDECDVDWENPSQLKHTIVASFNIIERGRTVHLNRFLAFKAEEVRNAFLEKHEELIKQYFMI